MKEKIDLVLFGAGKIGKAFVESKIYNVMKNKYNNIYFWDNNKELIGEYVGEVQIVDKDLWGRKNDFDIIITSAFVNEIYAECIDREAQVIYIFDPKNSVVSEYKEFCYSNLYLYKNSKYIDYDKNRKLKDEQAIHKFMCTNDLFANITGVAIMLSNLCNYALVHKLCPANSVKNKEILSSKVVYKILDELAESDFSGTLSFHIYNEPLMDPRLFLFISYAKQKMPDVNIFMYSNGYYINETMIKEMQSIGVNMLSVTAYGETEYRRLFSYENKVDIAYSILYGNLDERLDYYEKRDGARSYKKCNGFFNQVSIYSNGDIGLCCLDYKHPYNLGNVMKSTLREILSQEKIVSIQKDLLKGNREVCDICRNCQW